MRAHQFVTEAEQPDLFPGEFATKRTSIPQTRQISSRGDTETIKLPNVNSKGQQITSVKQALQNFWNWFGRSEAVDAKGRPLVFFHGTGGNVSQFKTMIPTKNTGMFGDSYDAKRAGLFFTVDTKMSNHFADRSGGNVMPVYLKMENPADFTKNLYQVEQALESAGYNIRMLTSVQYQWELFDEEFGGPDLVAALKKSGYDSAIIWDNEPVENGKEFKSYVVFSGAQVKSAVGNKGTYNQSDEVVNEDQSSFASWFNGSKVVDQSGKPLVVYHGSRSGGITRTYNIDTFFTDNIKVAQSYAEHGTVDQDVDDRGSAAPFIQPMYLRILNPLTVDAKGSNWDAMQVNGKKMNTYDLSLFAKRQGHDGVIIKNVVDHYEDETGSYTPTPATVFIVLGSRDRRGQIKSAIGNRGTFDPNDSNIVNEDWKKTLGAGAAAAAMAFGAHQALKQPEPKPAAVKKHIPQIKLQTNSKLEAYLFDYAKKHGLKGAELAQFMAQCSHESMNFTRLTERGTPEYFRKKYDPSGNPKNAKILGNTKPGDGAKYKGRGFLQLTGRWNYGAAEKALGLPLLKNPELLEQPKVAAAVSVWFWQNRVKPKVDNFLDTSDVTRPINRTLKGLDDRTEKFNAYHPAAPASGASVPTK